MGHPILWSFLEVHVAYRLANRSIVCRVCEKPIGRGPGKPMGWTSQFGEMVFPEKITLNYGEEFAHTDCLKTEVVA